MVDPEKKRRQREILNWLEDRPVEFAASFQGMPEGDASADAQLVVGGIFSAIEKLWGAMRKELPNVRLEDLIEVMFGDAEYWAQHPTARSRPPRD